MNSSSSRVNTLPQGLEGLQMIMALTPCRNASSSTVLSKQKSGGTRGTNMGSAPERMASVP